MYWVSHILVGRCLFCCTRLADGVLSYDADKGCSSMVVSDMQRFVARRQLAAVDGVLTATPGASAKSTVAGGPLRTRGWYEGPWKTLP